MRKEEYTSEDVYKEIKKSILYLELKPQEAISETEMGKRFALSRTPIREVFQSLEREGLLEVRPHVGTFVSSIDLHTVNDSLFMREKIEIGILEELMDILDPMQQFKISIHLMKQQELLQTDMDEEALAKAFNISDNQFHCLLFKLARRERVWENIMNSSNHYERFRVFINLTKKEDLMELYRQHLELADCLVSGHLVQLKTLLHEHLYGNITKAFPLIAQHPQYFVGNLYTNESQEAKQQM